MSSERPSLREECDGFPEDGVFTTGVWPRTDHFSARRGITSRFSHIIFPESPFLSPHPRPPEAMFRLLKFARTAVKAAFFLTKHLNDAAADDADDNDVSGAFLYSEDRMTLSLVPNSSHTQKKKLHT